MRQQASFFREGASHGQCPCRPCSLHSCACVSVSTGAPTIAIFAIRLQFSDTKYLGHSSVKRSVYFLSVFIYFIEKFTRVYVIAKELLVLKFINARCLEFSDL